MTSEPKGVFSSPIETAMINLSLFSGKTPKNTIPRPKSFSNIRKTSFDNYSNSKNSSNFSQFQSCAKPQISEKHSEISQSLINHLKVMNANNMTGTMNIEGNAKNNKTTHINQSVIMKNNNNTPNNSKTHHNHNHSMNIGVFNATKTTFPNKTPTNNINKPHNINNINNIQNNKENDGYIIQRPHTTTNSNKKFIDLYKRGGSISNPLNLSSKPGVSLNSSHNNISNASIQNNKGKSSPYYEKSTSISSNFGKDLENQTLNLIQELQVFSSNGNFENIVKKILDFLKKIPGLDPLFIALLGKLEEIILSNEQIKKRKLRELEIIRLRENESFSKKEKALQNEFELLQNKLNGFMDIFKVLQKKGVDFKELLKINQNTENSIDSSEKKQGKGLNMKNYYLKEKTEDFADESLINDSEESSFNYFGRPESPLSSLRMFQDIRHNFNKKTKDKGFKLNLKEVEKRKMMEKSSQSSESKKENKFLKKK